jgi:hypothetical protein
MNFVDLEIITSCLNICLVVILISFYVPLALIIFLVFFSSV